MLKKVFVAVRYSSIDERGKKWNYAAVSEIGGCNNLVSEVERLKNQGAAFILVCDTRKSAREVVKDWNDLSMSTGHYGCAEWANKDYHEEEQQTA